MYRGKFRSALTGPAPDSVAEQSSPHALQGTVRSHPKSPIGQHGGKYVVATTTATDDNGPKKPGAINGGFYAKQDDRPAQYPSVVIAVDSIKDAVKKVKEAGGNVLGEPMEIPGIGQYVAFTDTEGNRVSMLQPLPRKTQSPKSQ